MRILVSLSRWHCEIMIVGPTWTGKNAHCREISQSGILRPHVLTIFSGPIVNWSSEMMRGSVSCDLTFVSIDNLTLTLNIKYWHNIGSMSTDIVFQNQFLKSNPSNYLWLGLSRVDEYSDWKWEDSSEPVNYTNWKPNHPQPMSISHFISLYLSSANIENCWL